MEKYLGVKLIEAEAMNLGDYNKFKGWEIPKDENSQREGYKVKYSDDYISWSPKEVFEEAYRKIDRLTFGLAVEALKKGNKVARQGWNGKGMWLLLIKDWTIDAKHSCNVAGLLPISFIAMKTADSKFVPWLASQTDVLAEDWVIIE
jgi:hypothetical protein